MCYHTKFGRSRSYGLLVCWGHKILGDAGAKPLRMWAWLTLEYTLLIHISSRKNWVVLGHSVWALVWFQKIEVAGARPAPWDVGVAYHYINGLLHHFCYRAKLVYSHSTSNRTGVIITEIRQTMTPHVSPFKVSQGYWGRPGSTGCDLLLVIHK